MAVTAAALLGTTMASALALVLVWGVLHWMINVPQQLRVTAAAPDAAPLVLGLHQTAIYVGIAIGGIAGAAGLAVAGRPGIGYAAFVVGVVALAVLVLSFRLDPSRARPRPRRASRGARSSPRARAEPTPRRAARSS
jgi:predicted MFS family arabinose efflux permease